MESGSGHDREQSKAGANDRDLPGRAFRVLGEDLSRQDLALRREVKFLLPGADVGTLRSLMECNGRRLVHNEPVSTVRSVYFDDVQLSDCQATLDGISRRRKVRLRWYDSLDPGDVLFFEIKWRDNRVVGKHRLELRTQQPVSQLTYRQVIDNLNASVHLRALLTDLFLVDEILRPRASDAIPAAALAREEPPPPADTSSTA